MENRLFAPAYPQPGIGGIAHHRIPAQPVLPSRLAASPQDSEALWGLQPRRLRFVQGRCLGFPDSAVALRPRMVKGHKKARKVLALRAFCLSRPRLRQAQPKP